MSLKKNYIIFPILFVIFIFILSSLPVETISDKISALGFVKYLKIEVKNYLPIQLSVVKEIIQNMLHIPLFAILAFLWMSFFRKRQINYKKAVLYTCLITFLISNLDELYQLFVPERDASFLDLFLDMIGLLLGVVIYTVTNKSANMAKRSAQ